MFQDKSETYVDMVHLNYFINLAMIHEYSLRGCLFGLPILRVGRGLSLEDKADDKKLHAAYVNLLLLIFS